jgi:hypothetical protein|nr:MAG TPA: hypothetical protein [Caudoviricetes sp.]
MKGKRKPFKYDVMGDKNMNLIAINREDTKMIAKVEAMGTWEEERNIANEHNSFDIWTWNGKAYKIYKDSNREI